MKQVIFGWAVFAAFFAPCSLFAQSGLSPESPSTNPDEAGESSQAMDSELLAAAQAAEEQGDPSAPIAQALVRVRAVRQQPSFAQPWQRNSPQRLSSLGIALEGGRILTTAQAVKGAAFVELQAARGGGRVDANIVAIDTELNLALLEAKEKSSFVEQLKPVELVKEVKPQDRVELWQLEGTGEFSKTEGVVDRGIMSLYPGPLEPVNLAAEVRITVRARTNSQAAPFVKEGKLAGLLMNYENRQQTARMLPIDLIEQFLTDLEDGEYAGRASFLFGWFQTEELTFREWLGLSEDMGGVYIGEIPAEGGAQESGLQVGDVLLSLNGEPIDARGFVQVEPWGKVQLSYLIYHAQQAGDILSATVWRDRALVDLEIQTRKRAHWEDFVPKTLGNRGPNYLILGGVVLQELTIPYLREVGQIGAEQSLQISRIVENPAEWRKEHERLVVWCYTIPTPATFGYEPLNHLVIKRVNGKLAKDLQTVADLVASTPEGEMVEFELLGEPEKVYLNPELVNQVNLALIEQGLVPLSRIEAYTPKKGE